MKARDVMKTLSISRTTLYLYTKDGKLKGTKLDNGYYDYDEESVFRLLKKDNRINIIYARVSTYKQKKDLQKQINLIEQYCITHKVNNYKILSEIHSGLDLDRTKFSLLIDLVTNYKVKNIYITHKDRLTRLSFKTLKELFNKFGTTIITINCSDCEDNDNEIFEELISLMHIFSTTLYSKRRKNKLEIYKKDIENFISPE